MNVPVTMVNRPNTREEVHICEASSADCVTRLSGCMTDGGARPDMDVFRLPIP